MTQKSVHTERWGECLRGTTRLRCARIGTTSRSDTRSAWLLHGVQSAEPTRTRGSFGQQLQGDLRRCAGRGSHRPPIALPASSGYLSLSQHLRHRVYFRAGAYCNCLNNDRIRDLERAHAMHGWPILQMRQDHEEGLAAAIERGLHSSSPARLSVMAMDSKRSRRRASRQPRRNSARSSRRVPSWACSRRVRDNRWSGY